MEAEISHNGSHQSPLASRIAAFVDAQFNEEDQLFSSVPGGRGTLYGTAYALLTRWYLGRRAAPDAAILERMASFQDPDSGYLIGPELSTWSPAPGATHDREHLLLHLTCAALPVLQQWSVPLRHPLRFMERFVDVLELEKWLDARALDNPWLEGNNLLFIGQLLVYLRETTGDPRAEAALKIWFSWLDRHSDPSTGLWGTDRGASVRAAMCGGYHQLLVYYYDQHTIPHVERLLDATLTTQCYDGGFAEYPGGGACEDVDAVDILVNLYKILPYRRGAIRNSLRRCLKLLLKLQNADGGFPYKQRGTSSHMGIPVTVSTPGGSTMFATWFRTHTLALISEILDDRTLSSIPFQFSSALSMGWHRPWKKELHQPGGAEIWGERMAQLEGSPGILFKQSSAFLRRVSSAVRRRLSR